MLNNRKNSAKSYDLDWWLITKTLTLNLIKTHSKIINMAKKQHIYSLQKQLNNILSTNPRPHDTIKQVTDKINTYLESHIEGAVLRTKCNDLQGECMSSFAHLEENKRGVGKCMAKLLDDDGREFTDPKDIMRLTSDFYMKLYSATDIDKSLADYFLKSVSRLTPEQNQLCEGRFTEEEVLAAIKQSSNDTSPGIDGLPINFYKAFAKELAAVLMHVFNDISDTGILSTDQNCAIITLLCKNDKAQEKLTNWRPISLLCNDYKLITKVLTNRLSLVMEELVGDYQTCAVEGRSILANLHLLRNISDYAKQKFKNIILLSIDQAKAFDMVSIDYAQNFEPNFRHWLQFLYKEPTFRL